MSVWRCLGSIKSMHSLLHHLFTMQTGVNADHFILFFHCTVLQFNSSATVTRTVIREVLENNTGDRFNHPHITLINVNASTMPTIISLLDCFALEDKLAL